jgi:hypothetical protein
MRPALIAAAMVALGAATSCVTAEYRRTIVDEAVPEERVASLVPGRSGLAECLAALGAPSYVWEYRGDGLALGYGSYRRSHWGLSVSYQVANDVSASMSYEDLGSKTRGYVLFFDEGWVLQAVRAGLLRDLTLGLGRRRPAALEEERE